MKRRLTLSSERLTEVTPDDLAEVVGAAQTGDGLCAKLTIRTIVPRCPSYPPCPYE
jgi:hypothetical protein